MLSKRIKEEREKLELSQSALGKRIGVSQQTIGSWEVGRTAPDHDTIANLAKIFGITADELIGSNNSEANHKKKPQDLRKILEQHEIMFDGVPLAEEAKRDILNIIEFDLYKRSKELNKRKPKE